MAQTANLRNPEKPAKYKEPKGSLSKRIKKLWPLYIFMLPAVVYIFIFQYIPIYGVQIAFRAYNPALGVWGSRWVGLQHIQQFYESFWFWHLIQNTVILSLYTFIMGFPFPIIIALLLNELRNKGYKRTVQTVLYAPHFISMVVLCGIIITFLHPRFGMISHLLQGFGVDVGMGFMHSPSAFRHIFVWSGVWQSSGWGAIIYLAALSNVDPSLLEAASIDGATRMQKIWHINIPTIKSTVIILLILAIGSLIGVGADKVLLLQTPLNRGTSEVISTYVFHRAFDPVLFAGFSFPAAIGLFNNLINVMLLLIANLIARKVSETSLF
jgi:putative aldouronate transport system permease protein